MIPETLVPQRFFVFDVESVGLHGDDFAVGYVVIDRAGAEEDSGLFIATTEYAAGTAAAHAWARTHILPALALPVRKRLSLVGTDARSCVVRTAFWDQWLYWTRQGAWMAADVPWPVEANFLRACIVDDPTRTPNAPYPLIDIASVRFAAGLDPTATCDRLEGELPPHNPLADARQSARLLIEALTPKR